MRKILLILLSAYLIPIMTPSAHGAISAQTCGDATKQSECPAGCRWHTTSGCLQCTGNTYSAKGATNCTSCPDTHPLAPDGATSQSECYKKCAGETIDNGKFNDDVIATYDNECAPSCINGNCNFTCSTTQNDVCTSFTPQNAQCVSAITACTPVNGQKNTGIIPTVLANILQPQAFCYATSQGSCDENSTFIELTEQPFPCSTHTLGVCYSNKVNCSDKLGAPDSNGSIGGTAEINNGKYDYSNCTWTVTNVEITNGTGKKTCKYKGPVPDISTTTKRPTNEADWGTCTTEATTCNTGFCKDSTQCIPPRKGYYGDRYDCQKCPAGTTTAATGATRQSDCIMTRGANGTKFCDGAGNCFTLGGTGTIPYNPTN